jgi:hypothetical protein
MISLSFGEHKPPTVIELRHLHPCDLLQHEEAVAADVGISIDVGLSPTVLALAESRPGWFEGFLCLAKQALGGLTRLEKDGAPADLYLLKRGKCCELGTGDDFRQLWELTESEWSELLVALRNAG